ncbi:hypothetical protein BJ980_002243 [Nocardioides daedukensis]|uniref:DUF600 family protein n=1 Tax=Nocardioides daedukensis TaxID=634462 RepID=A0A7Y9RZV0_9ACTN|nr:hypothetical protein [Nocardioides daedukensis]NYG59320.1 hypothetical protein [Nocardioides daedukensis]
MSQDATVELIRSLVQNLDGPQVDWDGWQSMSMILEFPGGRFNSAHGFLYSPDGTISAVACRPTRVLPAVDAYVRSKYSAGDAPALKMLVRFDRTAGQYEVLFEESDEKRWQITPDNLNEIHADLRPSFD